MRTIDDFRQALAKWAESKPTLKALCVFGSYARGTATEKSDLDLAFEFCGVFDEADCELISNAQQWKTEVAELTGVVVKDGYHRGSPKVGGPVIQVFDRSN